MPRIPKLWVLAALGCAGSFYALDARASVHKYVLVPLIRSTMDPETAHEVGIKAMALPLLFPRLPKNWLKRADPEKQLETTLFANPGDPRVRPLVVQTPVGIAAGFDKGGRAIDALFQIGFSWVEIGSVTPKAQEGNPKPRMFRLPRDQAVINRYGFNSEGHARVLARLLHREQKGPRAPKGGVLAVNLGKNKTGDEIEDYVEGIKAFAPHADVLVVNVSSPNTPGLRDLQREESLTKLLTTLVGERNKLDLKSVPPLVVKIAPDLSTEEIAGLANAVRASKVDGVVVGNTTVRRQGLNLIDTHNAMQAGGLSGEPLKPVQLPVLRELRTKLGPDMTIIGCGGISTGSDALDYARAGANAVQLYTKFAYDGPGVPESVTAEILGELGSARWESVAAAGAANPELPARS